MPRVMAEDELAKAQLDFSRLEKSWCEENENFIRFQLVSNRDLQLAEHVLTEKQKGDLSVLRQTIKDRRISNSLPKLPNSSSLDDVASHQFILVAKSEFNAIESEIGRLTDMLVHLEQARAENRRELETNSILRRDNEILRDQIDRLSRRTEIMRPRLDLDAKMFEDVKVATVNHMTSLNKLKLKTYSQEVQSLSLILNATSSKLDEELSVLRREKRDPVSIEFPFSAQAAKSAQNYDEFLEAIVQQRTGDQLRQRQIERDVETMTSKYNSLVQMVSFNNKKCAKDLEVMQDTLESIEVSRAANLDATKSLRLKLDALRLRYSNESTQNALTINQLNQKISSLKALNRVFEPH